jgi:hypothetical protein
VHPTKACAWVRCADCPAACLRLKKAFAKRYRSEMKESDAARTLELLA